MLAQVNKLISENIGIVVAALVVAMLVLVYMCCAKELMTSSPEAPVFNTWPARDRAYWASIYNGGSLSNIYKDYDVQPEYNLDPKQMQAIHEKAVMAAGTVSDPLNPALRAMVQQGLKSPTKEGFCGDYNPYAHYNTPFGCGYPEGGADCCMGQLDRPFNGSSIISGGAYLRNVGQDRSDSDHSTSHLPGGEQHWRDLASGHESRFPLHPSHGHMTSNHTDPRESNLMGSMFGL